MSQLIYERNVLMKTKKDAITIYLEVIQRWFQNNHPGKILQKTLEHEAIQRWGVSLNFIVLMKFG
jgi:hypothetical protein